MKRRPEPEVMDAPEQARAYAEADFAEVNQGLVDRFRALWPELERGRLVDLGCGPADIPLRFCRALPALRVVAVDASDAMLALGRAAVREAVVEERVALVRAHLPRLPFPARGFEAVFSNSLLHHLADPMDLWREVARLGRPGAPVLVCDLFRPESEDAARRIVDEADCSQHPVLREDFRNSLLAAYSIDEVRTQLREAGLESLHAAVTSDRHLQIWGRLPG